MNKLPLLIISLSLSGCYLVEANYNKPTNRLDGTPIENEIRCEAKIRQHKDFFDYDPHITIMEVPCDGPYSGPVQHDHIVIYQGRTMEHQPYRPCEGEIAHIDGKRWCVGPWSDELVWTFKEAE